MAEGQVQRSLLMIRGEAQKHALELLERVLVGLQHLNSGNIKVGSAQHQTRSAEDLEVQTLVALDDLVFIWVQMSLSFQFMHGFHLVDVDLQARSEDLVEGLSASSLLAGLEAVLDRVHHLLKEGGCFLPMPFFDPA